MSDKKTSSATGGTNAAAVSSQAGAGVSGVGSATTFDASAAAAAPSVTGAAGGPSESGGAHGKSEGSANNRLRSQADELMQAAKQRAKDIAAEQKDAAAAQLGCVARGLREAAGSMQGESELAGRYAGKAAEGLERLSDDLRGADFDELVERTENYARRNPAVFLGGAVAAGFLFARFIKSSRERTRRRGSLEAYRAGSDASLNTSGAG